MSELSCTPTLDGLLPFEAAVDRLVGAARPIAESETVGLRHGLGRVVSTPVVSAIDVPGWDYSAMDGYAVCSADCAAAGAELPVSQRVIGHWTAAGVDVSSECIECDAFWATQEIAYCAEIVNETLVCLTG
mgnify:CR=1 FL=1